MKEIKLFINIILFLNILTYSFEIVPNWNIATAAVKLEVTFNDDNKYKYNDAQNDISGHNTIYISNKLIKEGDKIKHQSYLALDNRDEFEVDFDEIGSRFWVASQSLICPKRNFHPYKIYYDNGTPKISKETIDNSIDSEGNNWDLKCFYHKAKYFLVFYLLNGSKNSYGTDYYYYESNFNWIPNRSGSIGSELYDFKLQNDDSATYVDTTWKEYKMAALVLDSNNLKLKGYKAKFETKDDKTQNNNFYIYGGGGEYTLTTNKKYNQAYFTDSDSYNDFYFISYNNVSDFSCGYTTCSFGNSDYNNFNSVAIKLYSDSPFEFVDEVEIKQMNILSNNRYVYYTIYNTKTQENYYGLFDIKTNKIMFNTNEAIDTFVKLSDNSMLATIGTNIYKICPIIDEDGITCIEDCTTNTLIRDVDKNFCGTKCPSSDKYLIIPDNYCDTECDKSIYIANTTDPTNKTCGLCKDMNSDKPYKFIGGNTCLNESDIPDGAYVYNTKLKLLKCKSGYKLDDDNNNTCVTNCHSSCKTCSEFSEDDDEPKCLSCDTSNYYLEDTKCIKITRTTIVTAAPTETTPTTEITNIPTTITTTTLKLSPTTILVECPDEKCKTCNEESNKLGLCLTCNDGYRKVNYTLVLIDYLDCIKPEDPKSKKYYYNSDLSEYRPCYKTCRQCLKAGNAEENNCLECETNYMFRPGNNPYNNCVVFSEYYYISNYNQYKSLQIYQCPEEAKYYIKEKKSCIYDCTKDDTYKYLYNGNCLSECPEGTTNNNNICVLNDNKCSLGENDIYLSYKDNLEVINTLVKSYISEFSYTENYVSLYKNANYSIMIYKNRDCISELKSELPNVDFQSCYTKVQVKYGLTNQNLIIVVVDKKVINNANTFYSFYHPLSGIKLDAEEVCKEETIVVKESLASVLDKNDTSTYEAQISLTSQGINIFDLNDPFYTDICYDYDNPYKKDIPLNDRIKTLYPDVELCDEGCEISGINLEDMTSICDCKFNDITNNELIKDNPLTESVGNIFDLINSSNIQVFKCFKNIFTHFSRSIGGWISLTLIAAQIGLTLTFFLLQSSQTSKYIFNITKGFIKCFSSRIPSIPPKRGMINQKKSEKELKLKLEKKRKIKNIKKGKINTEKNYNDDLIIHYNETNRIQTTEAINIQTNDLEIYDKNFFNEYMATSPEDMGFDDAVKKDKRKYCEHMRENLIEDQLITAAFVEEDPLKPRSIKIMIFILHLILYFVVNGLFFSESVVSELYNVDDS